jgi:uncharacterized membrane protein HdeD (DUF308 family)
MKINEGRTDRIIRIVAGILMLILGIFILPSSWLAWVIVAVGAVLVITGAIGFCPLYALLKIKTVK